MAYIKLQCTLLLSFLYALWQQLSHACTVEQQKVVMAIAVSCGRLQIWPLLSPKSLNRSIQSFARLDTSAGSRAVPKKSQQSIARRGPPISAKNSVFCVTYFLLFRLAHSPKGESLKWRVFRAGSIFWGPVDDLSPDGIDKPQNSQHLTIKSNFNITRILINMSCFRGRQNLPPIESQVDFWLSMHAHSGRFKITWLSLNLNIAWGPVAWTPVNANGH